MSVHVTRHAILRFQERVTPCSDEQARVSMDSAAIRLAADIGAPIVKLGTGQRIVIRDYTVVTVLPKDCNKRRLGHETVGGNTNSPSSLENAP